jgi:hypothetical protein
LTSPPGYHAEACGAQAEASHILVTERVFSDERARNDSKSADAIMRVAPVANVEDLARFGLFHAGGLQPPRPVISDASRHVMQQPGIGGYGFGWSVSPDGRGRRVIFNSGAKPGDHRLSGSCRPIESRWR